MTKARQPLPTAEELGSRTAAAIRRTRRSTRRAIAAITAACRQWGVEAKRGLVDLIDLESLTEASGRGHHTEKRTIQAPAAASTERSAPQPVGPDPSLQARPVVVGVVDPSEGLTWDNLLEVSVLESLGFYDPDSEIVVRVEPETGKSPAGIVSGLASPSTVTPRGSSRTLIPDMDLANWKPRVIARSKLGANRLSTAMIAILSLSLLVLAIVAANLLRAPAETTARNTESLTNASTELTAALTGLESVLADPNFDVAESTSVLLALNGAARDLFDSAALLGESTQQQVLRQSAVSIAQSALQLESTIGDALSYRLVLNPLWNSPSLTGVVDPTEAATAVTTWQSQLMDMASALPVSPELASHVSQVTDFVDGLDAWRVRYLDALSMGDLSAADAALADLEGQLSLLAQSGEDLLTRVFSDAGTERIHLLGDLAAING
ncbi:MAG: hypothetical protein ACRDWH_03185 [Acidimicrobiia bacterium]